MRCRLCNEAIVEGELVLPIRELHGRRLHRAGHVHVGCVFLSAAESPLSARLDSSGATPPTTTPPPVRQSTPATVIDDG